MLGVEKPADEESSGHRFLPWVVRHANRPCGRGLPFVEKTGVLWALDQQHGFDNAMHEQTLEAGSSIPLFGARPVEPPPRVPTPPRLGVGEGGIQAYSRVPHSAWPVF